MADKTQANIGFEKQIWDAACVLWGHIPAAEYRKVIIGLIFLRYVSTAFERRYQELVEEGDGFEEDRDEYTAEPFEEKMARLTSELGDLFAESHRLEAGIREKLAGIGFNVKEEGV